MDLGIGLIISHIACYALSIPSVSLRTPTYLSPPTTPSNQPSTCYWHPPPSSCLVLSTLSSTDSLFSSFCKRNTAYLHWTTMIFIPYDTPFITLTGSSAICFVYPENHVSPLSPRIPYPGVDLQSKSYQIK